MSNDPAAPLDKRGQFIATRKRELFAALNTDFNLTEQHGEAPEQLYRLLNATIHHEFLDELERLHEAYWHLDPGRSAGPTPDPDAAYAALSESLERVLQSANFEEVHPELVERASTQAGRIRYPVRNGVADFRAVRLFRRGAHTEHVVRRYFFGLRKRDVPIEVYDEVVLFAALKADPPPAGRLQRWRQRRKRPTPPGSVMIKCFHNIASADLEALYPDVRVVMRTRDKLALGVPALVAGIPLLIKLAPAFFVLYGLLRFYLGEPAPGTDGIGEALIVASGVIALGGFLMNQWMKYERRALLYQREVNDMIYFHNVTNNVGIFDHIIGNAEEQETKEVLLAYVFLEAATDGLTEPELDARIEAWLAQRFGLELDFEVDDALRKLDRFGLLSRDGDRLSVLPMPAALAELDQRWDDLFRFESPAAAIAAD